MGQGAGFEPVVDEDVPARSVCVQQPGMASAAFGQHEQATSAFREALRLDPDFVPPRGNLAGSLIALDRFDEANGLVQEAISRGGELSSARQTAYCFRS